MRKNSTSQHNCICTISVYIYTTICLEYAYVSCLFAVRSRHVIFRQIMQIPYNYLPVDGYQIHSFFVFVWFGLTPTMRNTNRRPVSYSGRVNAPFGLNILLVFVRGGGQSSRDRTAVSSYRWATVIRILSTYDGPKIHSIPLMFPQNIWF